MSIKGSRSFFLMHQAMAGAMAGAIFGVIVSTSSRLLSPDIWQPKYPPLTIVLILVLLLGFATHFMVNGHVRLLPNEAKVQNTYGFLPSNRQTKIARISFWALAGLVFVASVLARNELFFWPI